MVLNQCEGLIATIMWLEATLPVPLAELSQLSCSVAPFFPLFLVAALLKWSSQKRVPFFSRVTEQLSQRNSQASSSFSWPHTLQAASYATATLFPQSPKLVLNVWSICIHGHGPKKSTLNFQVLCAMSFSLKWGKQL